MCYAKPGPRCSPHASQRYEKTGAKLKAALEEAQPELDRINEERKGVEGAKRATEADLPEKLRKKLQVARGRHRDATRQFDATPAGVEYLDEKVKESALKTKQAVDACNGWIAYKYPGETEESVKEQLKKDEDWTVLKQERTSCRSELTRVANRRANAEKYRKHDIAEYKIERAKQSAYNTMKTAAAKGSPQKFKEGRAAYAEAIKGRSFANAAELQRRRDPVISSPPLNKDLIKDGASKRTVEAQHSVNLSQGGRMELTTQCYISEDENTGEYFVGARVTSKFIPEDTTAPIMTRKNFGSGAYNSGLKEKVIHVKDISKAGFLPANGFVDKGNKDSLKQGEAYLRENKAQISYAAASMIMRKRVLEEELFNVGSMGMRTQNQREQRIRG